MILRLKGQNLEGNKIEYMQETVDGEKSRGGYGSSHPSVSTVVARAVGEKEGFPPKD